MADLGLNNTWISQTRVTHLLLIRFISFNVRLLFNAGHGAKVSAIMNYLRFMLIRTFLISKEKWRESKGGRPKFVYDFGFDQH